MSYRKRLEFSDIGFLEYWIVLCVGLFNGSSKKENGDNYVNKEIVVEVNSDKTTYMFMSRNQNAGRSHSIKTGNSSSEMVAYFKYC